MGMAFVAYGIGAAIFVATSARSSLHNLTW